MNFATFTIASVVALLGAFANAEEVARTNGETNAVIALASNERAPQSFASHGDLTGLYRTREGESFYVEAHGAGLTIESTSLGAEPLELTAESDGYVFVARDATRVVFERDEGGRVLGLRFFKPNTEVVAAAKTTPHGIVLIYDVPHRGIVRVYDII